MKIEIENLEQLEVLLSWNVSQNHTGRWVAIHGKISRSYAFMHEDKEEVLKWIMENYDK